MIYKRLPRSRCSLIMTKSHYKEQAERNDKNGAGRNSKLNARAKKDEKNPETEVSGFLIVRLVLTRL